MATRASAGRVGRGEAALDGLTSTPPAPSRRLRCLQHCLPHGAQLAPKPSPRKAALLPSECHHPWPPSANPTQVSRWTHGGKSVTVLLQRSGKRRWLASCCITDVGHCGPVSSELGTTVPDSSRLTVYWAQVAAILTRPSTLPPAHFPSRRSPVYIFLVSSR